MTTQAVDLISTRSSGILQKTEDNITSALPGDVTGVTRTTARVTIAELEADHHAWHARATERTEP